MIQTLPKPGKDPLRKSAIALGIYASLLGMEHGIFQILRSGEKTSGLMINAMGPTCNADLVWHHCFPALTILPTYLASGIAAVLISLYLLLWVMEFTEADHAARMIALFSLLLLPFGGGFVPVYTGLLASFSLSLHNAPGTETRKPPSRFEKITAQVWLPALWLYLAWFPLSWVFGYFFNSFILSTGPFFFLVFDILLPALIIYSARQHQRLAVTPVRSTIRL